MKKKKRTFLFALIFLFFLIFSASASRESGASEVSAQRPFLDNAGLSPPPMPNVTLPSFISRIFEEKSVYEDCNQHPEKYDIYDGKLMFETAPCYSNTCIIERTITHGTSMMPTIKDSFEIDIRKRDSNYNLTIGKIIAYDSLGQTDSEYSYNVIHRIVGIEGEGTKMYYANDTDYGLTLVIETPNGNQARYRANKKIGSFERPFFILKGDNNEFCEIVPRNAIQGILVGGSV